MRKANLRNAVVLIKYFAFLEEELRNPNHNLDEYTAAKILDSYRDEQELYMGPSFDTISSIGPNGAVIHYKPSKETASPLTSDQIYLLDSGC